MNFSVIFWKFQLHLFKYFDKSETIYNSSIQRPSGYQTKEWLSDFPGDPVVKTQCFQHRGRGLIPGWGSST